MSSLLALASAGEALPSSKLDTKALGVFCMRHLPDFVEPFELHQFSGGQSNPTFLISSANGTRYVLRKKPPGLLLPKAHQIEREYTVLTALGQSAVPVPRTILLCEDPAVVGTPFYLMDFVDGRVIPEPGSNQLSRADRLAMVDVLAAIHTVDWRAVGLDNFGRADGYIARQLTLWARQYEATTQGGQSSDMDALKTWLRDNLPEGDDAAITHGDFRAGNLMLAHDQAEIVAVLDWELATIGHPLSDLAYFCMPYHLPSGMKGVRGLIGLDWSARGVPTEDEVIERYVQMTGRDPGSTWTFFVAFSLFRLAAILQGVADRARRGNASADDAREVGGRSGVLAAAGLRVTRGLRLEHL